MDKWKKRDQLQNVIKELNKFYKDSFGVNETDNIVQLSIGCYMFDITVNDRGQYKMNINYHPKTARSTTVKNYIITDSVDCLIPYIKNCYILDIDKSDVEVVKNKDWFEVLEEMLGGTVIGNHLQVELGGSRSLTVYKTKKGKFVVNMHTLNNSQVASKYKCKTLDEVIVLVRALSGTMEG